MDKSSSFLSQFCAKIGPHIKFPNIMIPILFCKTVQIWNPHNNSFYWMKRNHPQKIVVPKYQLLRNSNIWVWNFWKRKIALFFMFWISLLGSKYFLLFFRHNSRMIRMKKFIKRCFYKLEKRLSTYCGIISSIHFNAIGHLENRQWGLAESVAGIQNSKSIEKYCSKRSYRKEREL